MQERYLERACGKIAKAHDLLFYKFQSPGNNGVPDRIVIGPGGRIVFVEFKTPVGTLTALQKRQIEKLESKGAEVHVIRSTEEFAALITSLSAGSY